MSFCRVVAVGVSPSPLFLSACVDNFFGGDLATLGSSDAPFGEATCPLLLSASGADVFGGELGGLVCPVAVPLGVGFFSSPSGANVFSGDLGGLACPVSVPLRAGSFSSFFPPSGVDGDLTFCSVVVSFAVRSVFLVATAGGFFLEGSGFLVVVSFPICLGAGGFLIVVENVCRRDTPGHNFPPMFLGLFLVSWPAVPCCHLRSFFFHLAMPWFCFLF